MKRFLWILTLVLSLSLLIGCQSADDTSGGTSSVAEKIETGSLGEIVGTCPLCGKNVIRGRSGYGCMGYKEGCEFRIGLTICKKTIPIGEIRRLLATGSTVKLSGFISKTGKTFRGRLVVKDGAVVFNFD